ncbi:MAG: hypothetical protein ACFB10_02720 [Salibacteraceae bacterium]
MENSHVPHSSFETYPSAYLALEGTLLNLFVTVTMPPYTRMRKDDEDLEGENGAVAYTIVPDDSGFPTSWIFQESFDYELFGDPANRTIGVTVIEEGNPVNGGTVIVHHADADEKGGVVNPPKAT